MGGLGDIAADADDLNSLPAQANRAARIPMPTCRRPRRNSTRASEPSMENRGADPDAPYSYHQVVEEAERLPAAARQEICAASTVAMDREPKKRACPGAVSLFKSAIAAPASY